MAASYFSCDGTVTSLSNNRLRCSTGWQTYTPPETPTAQTVEFSGELLTASQSSEFITAVIVLIALWAMFKIILHTFGVKI